MPKTKIKAANRAFEVRVLCCLVMGMCNEEIKGLLLACNVIAFRGQTQCFCVIIALLLQSERNEAMRGCFGFRQKKGIEWDRKYLGVWEKGVEFCAEMGGE